MCSQVFKILIGMASLLTAPLALAEGGGGGKPAEAVPTASARSAEDSFAEVQARVAGLEAKIHSGETEIEKLIIEKQHSTNPERTQEIITQMVTLHREMSKNLKEYDQQRSLLKYRYPEKGGMAKREYERIEVKSLAEIEDSMSLSSSLNKTMQKVRTQYESPMDEKSLSKKKSHTQGKKGRATDAPSLTDPLIIKK